MALVLNDHLGDQTTSTESAPAAISASAHLGLSCLINSSCTGRSLQLRGLHRGLQLHAVHTRLVRSHADIRPLIRTGADGLAPFIDELVMSRSAEPPQTSMI